MKQNTPSFLFLLAVLSFFFLIFSCLASVVLLFALFFGDKASLAGTRAEEVILDSKDPMHKKLYNVVEEMKIAASMRYMPKIYLLNVDYMNAFATGWREENAQIAITKPLFDALSRDELQAVIAHELTHIRNQEPIKKAQSKFGDQLKHTKIKNGLKNIMILILKISHSEQK